MSAPWNFNTQQDLEAQPLNMALLLLQQELAELGSGAPPSKQIIREDQHIEGIPAKQLEPAVCIKEEPRPLSMSYPYPPMHSNFNMVPQVWSMPQPMHMQRTEQTVPDVSEKTILNLDVKGESAVEKCNPTNSNSATECNKCNVPTQYSQEPACKNDIYSKRVYTAENFYNFTPATYAGPSSAWYNVKTFTGKETVNRWDFQGQNMRNYTNAFIDRTLPPPPSPSPIVNGQNSLVNGQNVEQEDIIHGPMAPDQVPICRVCGKGFTDKDQLINHMMVHRSRKPHVCEICEKSFSSPGNLKTHTMIHTGQKPHSCEKCGKKFTTLGNLKTHSVVHTAEKPHPCQICGKGFTTLGNLKTHLLIHTGERPYICEICGKRFTTRGNVKAHSVTHTTEKPFVCHICGKNFSHKGNLKTHIVSRHMTTKSQYECVMCGRSFTQAETLNTHIALVHAAVSVPYTNFQDENQREETPVFLPVKV